MNLILLIKKLNKPILDEYMKIIYYFFSSELIKIRNLWIDLMLFKL